MTQQTETEIVEGIGSDYKYGFSNPDEAKDYFCLLYTSPSPRDS